MYGPSIFFVAPCVPALFAAPVRCSRTLSCPVRLRKQKGWAEERMGRETPHLRRKAPPHTAMNATAVYHAEVYNSVYLLYWGSALRSCVPSGLYHSTGA